MHGGGAGEAAWVGHSGAAAGQGRRGDDVAGHGSGGAQRGGASGGTGATWRSSAATLSAGSGGGGARRGAGVSAGCTPTTRACSGVERGMLGYWSTAA